MLAFSVAGQGWLSSCGKVCRANAEAQGAITVDLPSPHGSSADEPFKGDMDMVRFRRCAAPCSHFMGPGPPH